jgi:hypothetical protein
LIQKWHQSKISISKDNITYFKTEQGVEEMNARIKMLGGIILVKIEFYNAN